MRIQFNCRKTEVTNTEYKAGFIHLSDNNNILIELKLEDCICVHEIPDASIGIKRTETKAGTRFQIVQVMVDKNNSIKEICKPDETVDIYIEDKNDELLLINTKILYENPIEGFIIK
ncbi:hypothetical protein [Methanobrevibacter sp. DSM 116169]|uniref:hypothetical protein n=1 Tax=Methanobrevibacter sp. DSM 116169 TaxID=3242727 RepID=UPI0038FC7AC9